MFSITRNYLIGHYQQSQCKLLGTEAAQLPLSDVLDARQIQRVIEELGITFRDRVFTPWVTLWTFLTQVLSADQSCRSAVSRLISWLSIQGKSVCSSATGAYVQARARLPEVFFQRLATSVGLTLHERTLNQTDWTFHGRGVKLLDGTMLTLSDTPENQKEYPQPKTKRKVPTPGFPTLRLLALISSSTGALLDLKMAPAAGKGTSESSLLRQMLDHESAPLRQGDVLLMDRLFCSYFTLATCLSLGIDLAIRIHCSMKTEKFEMVRRLGNRERLVRLRRPSRQQAHGNWHLIEKLPESILLREITHRVHVKGFRPKLIVFLTSFLDSKAYPKAEIAELYWSR